MNAKPRLKWQQWLRQSSRRLGKSPSTPLTRHLGFTLVELLVASLLLSVVILVAWTGLISIMNMTQAAEARSARQIELNRALDFMTNEIRMARSINATGSIQANGSSVSLADVVTASGLSLSTLGSSGDIGLYLERPTLSNAPAICPAGGPNAGLPPPFPVDFDRVVYDIRSSPSGWLSPKILTRYGRVPSSDGALNPCSSPIASDPMVDALAASRTPPSCSGVLSGSGGFYSCVTDKQTDLFFQSALSNVGAKQVTSSVASRLVQVAPVVQPTLSMSLNRTGFLLTDTANLSWSWAGTPPAVTSYKVRKTWLGLTYTPYIGTGNLFSYNLSFAIPGQKICFWVEATTSSGTTLSTSQNCFTK